MNFQLIFKLGGQWPYVILDLWAPSYESQIEY